MLPSGAHVKIADDEYFIDRSVENHYTRRWYDLDDEEDPDIAGDPGKRKRNAESLFWTYSDWAGGEGNRVFDLEQPDKYDVAYELNPRVRGQLTGRPNRRRTTVAAKDLTDRPVMAVGAGAVWLLGGYGAHYSTSGPISWTSLDTSGTAADDDVGLRSLNPEYRVTAAVGDHDWVYYSAWNNDNGGERVTLRQDRTAEPPDVVQAEAIGKAPYAGLAMMKGDLFAWTGRKLYQMEVSNLTDDDANGLTGTDQIRKVYDTGVDPSSSNVFSASWWAECIATENSIIMWYSNDGVSKVYEYKKGVGRPIWTPPYGFTIKGSTYANGVVYFSGHWGADENDGSGAAGTGALYALPLSSYSPFPLHKFRNNQNVNLQMQEMHTSYGYQVITVAQRTGRIFIYDAESDGVTMLDDLERASGSDPDDLVFTNNDHRIAGSVTWGKHRYFAVYRPGQPDAGGGDFSGSYQIVVYDDDNPEQREEDLNSTDYTGYQGFFQTPRWDYGYPLDKKSLIGFHLHFKPLVTGQAIDVSYDENEDDSYTSLTQVTSATTGNASGRVFIPVSTPSAQKKFMTLKFRVKLSVNANSTPTPILYAVTAEAKCSRKRREWEIVLRVKDEESRTPRPADRQVRGWRLRDLLETTIENGDVIAFLDGYRYKDQALYGTHYSTHNVTIKQAEDTIEKPGEGSMRLLLRSVDLEDND